VHQPSNVYGIHHASNAHPVKQVDHQARCQAVQKLVSENSQHMQSLHQVISKKLYFYMQVKGMSRVEAINKVLAKIIKHKSSPISQSFG
jgi:hypothetical protein